MHRFYRVLIVAIMIGFSGCTGASVENPTIKLKGNTSITLGLGERFDEPGYRATDVKDGDLTNYVEIEGSYYYDIEGTYHITYSVEDSDGNRAEAVRTIFVTQNPYNSTIDKEIGTVAYDLAAYYYNAYLDSVDNVVVQDVYDVRTSGSSKIRVTFEKYINETTGYSSIYQYHYNQSDAQDMLVERDIIKDQIIEIIDYEEDTILDIPRYVKMNEPLVSLEENGVTMSCMLREYYTSFSNQSIQDVIGEELVFSYDDVLRIQCVGSNGFISDTYLAKYWGEVLSVSSFNGELVYSVPDKNFSSQ